MLHAVVLEIYDIRSLNWTKTLSFDGIIMDESGEVTPEQTWIPLPLLSNRDNARITAYGHRFHKLTCFNMCPHLEQICSFGFFSGIS